MSRPYPGTDFSHVLWSRTRLLAEKNLENTVAVHGRSRSAQREDRIWDPRKEAVPV